MVLFLKIVLLSQVAHAEFDWNSFLTTTGPTAQQSNNDCHARCWNENRFCGSDGATCMPCWQCNVLNGFGNTCGQCGSDVGAKIAQLWSGISAQSVSTKVLPPRGQAIAGHFICMMKPNHHRRRLVEDSDGRRRLADPAVASLKSQLEASSQNGASANVQGAGASAVAVHNLQTHVMGLSGEMSPGALAMAANDANTDFCVYDEVVHADALQLVSGSEAPWGLDRSDQRANGLNGLFETGGADGEGVDIYVVDTGVNKNHADFQGRLKGGFNAVADGNGADDWGDCNGHGSHCAGSAAGTIYGVAKKANIFGVRVLGQPPSSGDSAASARNKRCSASGAWSSVLTGMDWVLSQASQTTNPVVATMSIGGNQNQAIDTMLEMLLEGGVTTVVAAGNENQNTCMTSPAGAAAAIAVGATDRNDKIASFSNWGTCVDIMAPGVGIWSAWCGNECDGEFSSGRRETKSESGTSMATPHVAGAVALHAAILKKQTGDRPTPQQLRQALMDRSVKDVISVNKAGSFGTPSRMLYTAFELPDQDFFSATPNQQFAQQQRRLRGEATESGLVFDGGRYT